MRPVFCLLGTLLLGACGTTSSDPEALQPRFEQHMRVSSAETTAPVALADDLSSPQCEMFISSMALAESKSHHALLSRAL